MELLLICASGFWNGHDFDDNVFNNNTVKPRFTAVFGGKEISAVNGGPR